MITLTPFTDMVPVPRVEVVVTTGEMLAGSVFVTLRSRVEDRTFDVRGAVLRSAAVLFAEFDYAAPFGVDVTYELACYGAGGEDDYLGTVVLGTTLVDSQDTVIQQPLDPKLNAVVQRLRAMASTVSRPARADLIDLDGRTLPAVVGTGPRRGVTDLPLEVLVESHAMADRLQATLGTYEQHQPQVWLVRTPPPMRIPRVFYCHVPELVEVEVNNHIGGQMVAYQATVTEVPPPAPALAAGVLRYSDVGAVFSGYAALGGAYTLYSDIKRDSSLVGAAG